MSWLDILEYGNGHRYSTVIAFVEAWFGGIEPEDGIHRHELASARALVGMPLPAALAEWYALLGLRDELLRQDHVLIPPMDLEWWENHLPFWTSRDAHILWFIDREDMRRDDPPVQVLVHDTEGVRVFPMARPLSRFVTEMTLVETSMAAANHGLTARPDPTLREELSPVYHRLPIEPWPVVVDAMYGKEDTLLTFSKTGRLHLGARDREAFRRALGFLEGRGVEIEVEWTE